MATPVSSRRNPSLSGSSRLSLSVGKSTSTPEKQGRHPLKHDWSISYLARSPGAKVDYEKETKRIATFGSIESFLHLYSHLTPIDQLTPVTDLLIFLSRIPRPGVWEEMRDGGKFTIRLLHPITPLLFESLLFGMIGDQFEENDSVVGCVVSHRVGEDMLSVWVEEEGESVKSGQLREKIITLLNLPPGTTCEYRSNRAFIDAATKPHVEGQEPVQNRGYNNYHHHHENRNQHHENRNRNDHSNTNMNAHNNHRERGDRGDRDNQHHRDGQHPHQHHNNNYRHERTHAPRGFRRDEEGGEPKESREPREPREPRERPEGREPRSNGGWGR